jgi:zinc-binding in reverse transcriptase
MNIAFLCKWAWKYRFLNEQGLWQSIIMFKYHSSNIARYSAFWKAVSSVSSFLLLGAKRVLGTGKTINFWLDTWHRDYPLSVLFPLVYAKSKTSLISLYDVWNHGNITLHLTRGVSLAMRHEKNQLINLLHSTQFTTDSDSAIWSWESSGLYTIKSMYTFLCFGGVYTPLAHSVWSLKIPLKHKLFLWLALHNKILTRDNLRKKGWMGDTSCLYCTNSETVDHLFFNCPFIAPFWSLILTHHPQGYLLDVSSLLSFWNSCLTLSSFTYWGTLLAASLWVLWLDRNKRVFSTSAHSRAASIYFLILQLFQFWTGSSLQLEHTLVMAVGTDSAPSATGGQVGTNSAATGAVPIRTG